MISDQVFGDQRYARKFRVRRREDYKRFYGRTPYIRLRDCLIFRVPNDLGHPRVGITLKAKTNAVHRNKTKRCVREVFRTSKSALGSFDYNVVIPRSKKIGYRYIRNLRDSLAEKWRASERVHS